MQPVAAFSNSYSYDSFSPKQVTSFFPPWVFILRIPFIPSFEKYSHFVVALRVKWMRRWRSLVSYSLFFPSPSHRMRNRPTVFFCHPNSPYTLVLVMWVTWIAKIFPVIDGFITHVLVMDIIHLLLIPVHALVTIGIRFRKTIQQAMLAGICCW